MLFMFRCFCLDVHYPWRDGNFFSLHKPFFTVLLIRWSIVCSMWIITRRILFQADRIPLQCFAFYRQISTNFSHSNYLLCSVVLRTSDRFSPRPAKQVHQQTKQPQENIYNYMWLTCRATSATLPGMELTNVQYIRSASTSLFYVAELFA